VTIEELILIDPEILLKLIPLWSQNMIDEEYKRIKLMSKCEYLDDLIQAMFASYSQILLADNKSYDNLNVSIPTPTHVIHSCYITIARSIWKKPGILYHRNNNTTLTNNLTLLNQVITDDINSTIRNLLPFKEILENYLEQNNKNTEIEENLTDSIGNVDINSINETDVIDEGEDIENYEVVEDTEYEEGVVEDGASLECVKDCAGEWNDGNGYAQLQRYYIDLDGDGIGSGIGVDICNTVIVPAGLFVYINGDPEPNCYGDNTDDCGICGGNNSALGHH
jgi:hypothetical protein